MKPVIITINSYNLEEIAIMLIRKLIADDPFITKKSCAESLGISQRTLYRWQIKYKLIFPERRGKKIVSIEEMIKRLELLGYKVMKD